TIRNATYSAVHLGSILNPSREAKAIAAEMAVLVQCPQGQLCIMVDDIVGHRQVVVTSLDNILPESTSLSGVAQLGSGRLAPVLNIQDIVKGVVSTTMCGS
ncbi:MAG: chemotaxis protein CheW, partial [Patescibacteria group bacterium]|nr:chemotaxis protein CheW [Patescibacteria group bacterium]